MAFDSKSNIGQQIANPGNSQIGQATIHEQRLTSIPLGQNTARQIDLLNMEQFGWNTTFLRERLGGLEAISVNSDREYGVLQADDSYDFTNKEFIPIEYSISGKKYNPIVVEASENSGVEDIPKNGYIEFSGTDAIVLPHVFVTNNNDDHNKVHGLQALSSTGDAKFYANTEITADAGVVNIDENDILTTDVMKDINASANDRGRFLYAITANVTNFSNKYKMRLYLAGVNDDGNWYSAQTEILAENESDPDLHLHVPNGIDEMGITIEVLDLSNNVIWRYRHYSFVPIFDDPISWIGRIYVTDRTDHDKTIQEFHANLCPVGYIMPECAIGFTWHFTGGAGDKDEKSFVRFSKSISNNSSSQYVLDDIGDVYDWSYFKYVPGFKWNSANKTKLNVSLINATNMHSFLVGTDFYEPIGFKAGTSIGSYKYISGYTNLIDVDEDRSIILCKRSDNVQIGARLGSKIVTAKYDVSIYFNEIEISSLNIIRTSGNGFDFIVRINGAYKYYSVFYQDDIDGNKLILGSRNIPMMTVTEVNYSNKSSYLGLKNVSTGIPTVTLSTVALDDNIYYQSSADSTISLTINGSEEKTTVLYLSTVDGLKNCLLRYRYSGTFVSDALSFYIPNATSLTAQCLVVNNKAVINPIYDAGKDYFHLATIPAFNKTLSAFTTLPLRMEDEYPEVYNNSPVCTNFFVLGKTGFVFKDGTLYEAGSLRLCPDTSKLYVSEPGSIAYRCTHLIFLAGENLTSVYTFSELGLVLLYVIEDKIICEPVKLSFGVLAIGKACIWQCTNEGAMKMYRVGAEVTEAAIRTDIDNSAIVVMDAGERVFSMLQCSDMVDPDYLVCNDGNAVGIAVIAFSSLSINQFGYVSRNDITTNFSKSNFINAGAQSDLVVIDKQNGIIGTLTKSGNTSDNYSFQTSQYVQTNDVPMEIHLVQIAVFAKGLGNIDIVIDGETRTIAVNSINYKRYRLNIYKDLDCFSIGIIVDKDVKMLQKIIGTISMKEVYYG